MIDKNISEEERTKIIEDPSVYNKNLMIIFKSFTIKMNKIVNKI